MRLFYVICLLLTSTAAYGHGNAVSKEVLSSYKYERQIGKGQFFECKDTEGAHKRLKFLSMFTYLELSYPETTYLLVGGKEDVCDRIKDKFSKLDPFKGTYPLNIKRSLVQEVVLHFSLCKVTQYYEDEISIEGATAKKQTPILEEIFATSDFNAPEDKRKEFCLTEWEKINQKQAPDHH